MNINSGLHIPHSTSALDMESAHFNLQHATKHQVFDLYILLILLHFSENTVLHTRELSVSSCCRKILCQRYTIFVSFSYSPWENKIMMLELFWTFIINIVECPCLRLYKQCSIRIFFILKYVIIQLKIRKSHLNNPLKIRKSHYKYGSL